MSNKKKILVIGGAVTDFFIPIAESLQRKNIEIDLIEFREDQKRTNLNRYFSTIQLGVQEIFDFQSYSPIKILLCLFSRTFWGELFLLRNFKEAVKVTLIHQEFGQFFGGYDLINIHSLREGSMWFSRAIKVKTPIIFSFWGSDLFAARESLVKLQNVSLKKASVITMQTPEMEQVFREKFPNLIQKEVSLQRFGVLNAYLDGVDEQLKKKNDTALREQFNLPKDKMIVTISYSANAVSNHLRILDSIDELPNELKAKIHLLFPFSYGGPDEYRQEVKDRVKQVGCTFYFMDQFLDMIDLIKFRIVSDIYIHANKTDAFSNSMLEYLYSGNLCLIADWLPYQLLRNVGAGFIEFNNFQDLRSKLENAILNFVTLQDITRKNAQLVRQNFSLDSTVQRWVELIEKES